MFSYNEYEKSFLKASEETLSPILNEAPQRIDEVDFFPGRRFYIECFSPDPSVLFLEMEFPLKKQLISEVFHKPWMEISDVMRDDCMLEILNVLVQKHIAHLFDPETTRFRTGGPMVIYDEYEDNMEISTLDMYRFDFKMSQGGFAIVLARAPSV